jgi:hypothetical protein
MIPVMHKGGLAYFINADLVEETKLVYKVRFKGKMQVWPKKNAEMITKNRFALRVEFYDLMYDQSRFKQIAMKKVILHTARKRMSKN